MAGRPSEGCPAASRVKYDQVRVAGGRTVGGRMPPGGPSATGGSGDTGCPSLLRRHPVKLNDFEPTRRLTTRTQAREAFDDTLAETQRFLRIFERDGEFFGFDRRSVAQALRALLRGDRNSRVSILLHDVRHIEQHCPLLLDLLRSFAPRLSVLRTSEGIRNYARGLVIADDRVVLRRPHFDQTVTYVDYDEKAIAAAAQVFEELLGHAGEPLSASATGL